MAFFHVAWRSMGTLFISAWVKAFQINQAMLTERSALCDFTLWTILPVPSMNQFKLAREQVIQARSLNSPFTLHYYKLIKQMALNLCFLSLSRIRPKNKHCDHFSFSLSCTHTYTESRPTWFWRCSNNNNIHKMVPTFLKLQCTKMPLVCEENQSQTPSAPASFFLIREQHTSLLCKLWNFFRDPPSKVAGQDFWVRAISDVGHGSWRTPSGYSWCDAVSCFTTWRGEEWNPLRQWITNASVASSSLHFSAHSHSSTTTQDSLILCIKRKGFSGRERPKILLTALHSPLSWSDNALLSRSLKRGHGFC